MGNNNHYIITSNFGNDFLIEQSTHDLRFQCPRCKEHGKTTYDYKLYVSYDTLVFHCFRCDWKGKLEVESQLEEGSSNQLIKALSNYKQKVTCSDESDTDEVVYKLPTIIPTPTDPAVLYLERRGVDYDDILRYNMRVASIDDPARFMGRIVIPNRVIAGKWTDMYSARTYTGQEPKYLNPKNSPRAKIVFNLHNIQENCEQIIINEGVLTSIVAGPDSVATYGKAVTDAQVAQIVAKLPKRIYISLDNDADPEHGIMKDPTHQKIVSVVKRLLTATDAEIYVVKMPPGKDAVDVGRNYYRNVLLTNSIRIRNIREYEIYSLF